MPDVSDPGSVLHEAIGRVDLLVVAIDNGLDRFICAGPVLSHYEFEVIGDPRRISDAEWKQLLNGLFPEGVSANAIEGLAPPSWTESYLAK